MDLSLQLQHDLVAVQTETHPDVLVELTAPTPAVDVALLQTFQVPPSDEHRIFRRSDHGTSRTDGW